jgi:plasmid stability protein
MSVSLSIKDVPNDVVRKLRARARQNHRSIQGELMSILEAAVRTPRPFQAYQLQREIRALGLTTPAEAVQMIREDRDR